MKNGLNFVKGLSRSGRILLLFGIIFIAGLIASFALRSTDESRRQSSNDTGYQATADQFMEGMAKRDAVATYKMFTKRAKELVGTQAAWQQTLKTFPGKEMDFSLVDATTISDPEKVYKGKSPHLIVYTYRLHDAKWQTSLTVIKSDKTWKVDHIITGTR